LDEPSDALKIGVTRQGALRFAVTARPRARSSRVAAVRAGALVVELAASPVLGAANAELVATLARSLGLPRRDVVLVHGETSRVKLVEVHGLHEHDLRARLAAALG
jgi:uncharacterized protein YggU (UPF0235/DUF167 family)